MILVVAQTAHFYLAKKILYFDEELVV